MAEQRTLSGPVRCAGVGLHTGERVSLEMLPADPWTGIVFVRTDLPGAPRVEARVENLVSRPRRTALQKGTAEVHTTEHLLAVLSAVGIHNLEVRIDGPELPGLDGSSLPFYEAIREAGVSDQGEPAPRVPLKAPIAIAERDATLVAFPGAESSLDRSTLTVGYTLDYSSLRASAKQRGATLKPEVAALLTQFLEIEITEETFAREIAPARTFVFADEIQALRQAGLGKGANTKNTVVLDWNGVIDNELRFPDELVRHKILDLIGDLYLLGFQLGGRLLAVRSGHSLNMALAKRILENVGPARGVSLRPLEAAS